MADEEQPPTEQPTEETPAETPAEGEAPAEGDAAPAAAAVSVEDVKGLAPNEAWEKHPQLKEAYEALEDKEGILEQAEAAEGEDPPAPTWGEKADEFLEGNKDKFTQAEGEAAAEPEKPKEPLKKVIKTITAEEVAAAVAEKEGKEAAAVTSRWEAIEKQGGADKALDKLSKEAFNGLLDCTVPVDVVSLGKTCRDLYTRFGKPRAKKEQMRWNNVKAVYEWEKGMGGPLWDFPEGQTTKLDGPADDLVDTQFVDQSKKGNLELNYGVPLPTNKRIHRLTYEAIVRRSLGNRLKARGLDSFDISLTEYQEEGDSTFTVAHRVLDGEKGEVLDRAIAAIKVQMDIKALMEELKKAKNLVAEAVLNSQEIQERAEALKQASSLEIDASAPIHQLRSATKESQEKIRETLKQLEEAANDKVFAEKVAGGAGEGKQAEFRVNLARRLRLWLEAQQANISKAVDSVNEELLEKSMTEETCTADTAELTVKALADSEAPEFLDLEEAVKVLEVLFKIAIEATLGDSAEAKASTGEDTVKWAVELKMDV
eukprot:Hpha_TRINITY_DN16427_c1_g4::TRINITY_DN16427_c1_g4_i4::g.163467::m.163467